LAAVYFHLHTVCIMCCHSTVTHRCSYCAVIVWQICEMLESSRKQLFKVWLWISACF